MCPRSISLLAAVVLTAAACSAPRDASDRAQRRDAAVAGDATARWDDEDVAGDGGIENALDPAPESIGQLSTAVSEAPRVPSMPDLEDAERYGPGKFDRSWEHLLGQPLALRSKELVLPVPPQAPAAVAAAPAETDPGAAPGEEPLAEPPARERPPSAGRRPIRMWSEHLLGAPVHDRGGARVGSVSDLLVDPESGEPRRLVVHTVEGSDVDLPWSSEDWTRVDGALVLSVDAESLASGAELDPRRLFEGRALERIEGEILSVDAEAEAAGDIVTLKLREPDNRIHRVLLGTQDELGKLRAELAPPRRVQVNGLFTRDESGTLFVARTIATSGGSWERAIPSAEPPGRSTARERSLARPFVRWSADKLDLVGFFVDGHESRVTDVLLLVGGEPRIVPWSALAFEDQAGWSVSLDPAELERYPPFAGATSPGERAAERP